MEESKTMGITKMRRNIQEVIDYHFVKLYVFAFKLTVIKFNFKVWCSSRSNVYAFAQPISTSHQRVRYGSRRRVQESFSGGIYSFFLLF